MSLLQSKQYATVVPLPAGISVYDSANFTSIEEENASEGIESCEYMTVSSSNVSEHVSSPRSSLHLSECSHAEFPCKMMQTHARIVKVLHGLA